MTSRSSSGCQGRRGGLVLALAIGENDRASLGEAGIVRGRPPTTDNGLFHGQLCRQKRHELLGAAARGGYPGRGG
jgi:hypothetical protein